MKQTNRSSQLSELKKEGKRGEQHREKAGERQQCDLEQIVLILLSFSTRLPSVPPFLRHFLKLN